ncbi:hypothetical protein CHUAL_007377 [Chamberlinius hualienensis]
MSKTEEWLAMNQRCSANMELAEPMQNHADTKCDSGGASGDIVELVDEIHEFQQQPCGANSEPGSDVTAQSDQQQSGIFAVGDPLVPVRHCIIVSCDFSKLTTPVGMLKLIILVTCIVSLACVGSTDYPQLVISTYTRIHIFSVTFVFLTVLVIFLLELLTLLLLFPINWSRWNAGIHTGLCVLIGFSSTVMIHAQFTNEDSMPRLDRTVELLIVSGVSGYFCALMCMLLSLISCCCYDHHLSSSSS